MATRSTIWTLNNDGTYDGIYCHNDGYVEHNGVILLENYRTQKQVRDLINDGSHSVLSTDHRQKLSYSEKEASPCTGPEYKNMPANQVKFKFEEYNYFFMGDEWIFFEHTRDEDDRRATDSEDNYLYTLRSLSIEAKKLQQA